MIKFHQALIRRWRLLFPSLSLWTSLHRQSYYLFLKRFLDLHHDFQHIFLTGDEDLAESLPFFFHRPMTQSLVKIRKEKNDWVLEGSVGVALESHRRMLFSSFDSRSHSLIFWARARKLKIRTSARIPKRKRKEKKNRFGLVLIDR